MTEPRSSWLLISLAGTALAASGYVWGFTSSPAAGPRGVASEEGRPVVVSVREIPGGRPATAHAAVQSRQEGVPRASTVAGSELSSGDAEQEYDLLDDAQVHEELDPEEAEARSRAARIKHFDELSQRIDCEVVDGAWRHATEGPLKRLISEHLGPKIGIAEATCASTFCRLKLTHPEWPGIPAGWTFAFDLARASLEVTEVEYDNRAEGATTLYFKRGAAPANQPVLADAN